MAEQIPQLEAEERLGLITDVSVATGNVRKGSAQAHHRRLSRHMKSESRPATTQDLRSMGFKIDG